MAGFADIFHLQFTVSAEIKGRHNGESLFWQCIPAATSIINVILPIISAEPALFGARSEERRQLEPELAFWSKFAGA
jgi:hypothetical protein